MASVPTKEELKAFNKKVESLASTPANAGQDAAVPSAPPGVSVGGLVLKSKPLSLTKMLGLSVGVLDHTDAKAEYNAMIGFRKALRDTGDASSDAVGNNRVLPLPISASYLKSETVQHEAAQDIFRNWSNSEIDLDEIRWAADRMPAFRKSSMSYLQDTIGGATVAPPAFGELIEIMRNKSVFDRCGATRMPIPAQGKWVAPRVTGVTTGYNVKENQATTESNPTFGQISLEAKKISVLVRIPNELFKFSSVAFDAVVKKDMGVTLALDADYQGLYGPGSGQIKGLINYTGTGELVDYAALTSPAPKGLDTNGNTVRPEDGYAMSAQVMERNFDDASFKWVCRPILRNTMQSYRSDAVTAKDQAGLFVQAITRALNAGASKTWCDYEVVTSTQVRNNQTKASGTGLTELFGGCWDQVIMGMYGAIEFIQSNTAENAIINDQTLIRGNIYADFAFKHPGAFVYYKQLYQRNP